MIILFWLFLYAGFAMAGWLFNDTSVHACEGGGEAYALIFLNSHQSEMVGIDQPQTRKLLLFSDAVSIDWHLNSRPQNRRQRWLLARKLPIWQCMWAWESGMRGEWRVIRVHVARSPAIEKPMGTPSGRFNKLSCLYAQERSTSFLSVQTGEFVRSGKKYFFPKRTDRRVCWIGH